MATPTPDYKFIETRGASAIYPWDQWLNGETWQIVRRIDFFVLPESMKNLIYVTATRRGLKAKVAIEGESIYLRATPRSCSTTGVTLDGNGNSVRRTP